MKLAVRRQAAQVWIMLLAIFLSDCSIKDLIRYSTVPHKPDSSPPNNNCARIYHNSNGQPVKRLFSHECTGKWKTSEIWTYDEEGRLATHLFRSMQDFYYIYDEQGRPREKFVYNRPEATRLAEVDNLQEILDESVGPFGRSIPFEIDEYTYQQDSKTILIKNVWNPVMRDGQLVYQNRTCITENLDEHGNALRKTWDRGCIGGADTVNVFEYEYTPSGLVQSERYLPISAPGAKEHCKFNVYDESGRLIQNHFEDKCDGKRERCQKWTYDNQGLEIMNEYDEHCDGVVGGSRDSRTTTEHLPLTPVVQGEAPSSSAP